MNFLVFFHKRNLLEDLHLLQQVKYKIFPLEKIFLNGEKSLMT
jgi:hypothetical protein